METLSDELLVSFASFLSPADLVSLAQCCKQFGARYGNVSNRMARRMGREAKKQKSDNTPQQQWSLVEEAARKAIDSSGMSSHEKGALIRRGAESWIGIYQELLLIREPLKFDQIHGKGINHKQPYAPAGLCSKSLVSAKHVEHGGTCCAISQHVMRAGKHFAVFTMQESNGGLVSLGVMRPIDKDIRIPHHRRFDFDPTQLNLSSFSREQKTTATSASNVDGESDNSIDCCMVATRTGCCMYSEWNGIGLPAIRRWHGMEQWGQLDGVAQVVIGLLLDLDEGTLTVFKDGQYLGSMMHGLAGEYCWYATLLPSLASDSEPFVHIKRIAL